MHFLYFFIVIQFSTFLSIHKSFNNEIYFFQDKYKKLMTFIHEFHHIVATTILDEKYTDFLTLHMVVGDINNQKYLCNAYVANISFKSLYCNNFTLKDSNNQIIKKIKFALSGYASEEAFKQKSFIFYYFNKKEFNSYYTVSFPAMLYRHFFLSKGITDINYVLQYEKLINYQDPTIQKYIQLYAKENDIINNCYLNKIECKNINNDFIYLLSYLYQELIKEYSKKDHQKKISLILKNNPDIAAYEIFFLPDLQSLWRNNTLNRDITEIKNFTNEEKKIIESLNKKIIHDFNTVKKFKKKYKKYDYIYFIEQKNIEMKENLISFFKKYFKKGYSFYNFLKKKVCKY